MPADKQQFGADAELLHHPHAAEPLAAVPVDHGLQARQQQPPGESLHGADFLPQRVAWVPGVHGGVDQQRALAGAAVQEAGGVHSGTDALVESIRSSESCPAAPSHTRTCSAPL